MRGRKGIIAVLVLGALVGVVVFAGCASQVRAQASSWSSSDWQRISKLYYGEGQTAQPAAAIELLIQTLENKGNQLSDEILEQMLAVLKEHFSTAPRIDDFRRIMELLMGSGKETRIVEYFKDIPKLSTPAKEVQGNWLRPDKAMITVLKSSLAVDEVTEYTLIVTNKRGNEIVGATGVEIVASPEGLVKLDPAAKKIAALAPGSVRIDVKAHNGTVLGSAKLSIAKPILTAKLNVAEDELEIGGSTTFDVKCIDQNRKKIPTKYEEFTFELDPTNLADLDEAERRITARKAGNVTLRAQHQSGASYEADITIKEEIIVEIRAPERLEVHKDTVISFESTRPILQEGLAYSFNPPEAVIAREVGSQQTSRQIQVRLTEPGDVTFTVVDKTGKELKSAVITGYQKERVTVVVPPPKCISGAYPIIGGAATMGLAVAAAATKEAVLGVAAGGCAVATGVLLYLYMRCPRSNDTQTSDASHPGALQFEVGVSRMGFVYRF